LSPKPEPGERRTLERLRQHYEIEKALTARLMQADREERKKLYAEVYDELCRRVPDHILLARKADSQDARREVSYNVALLRPFLKPDSVFVEIGAGDCALSFEIAKRVAKVIALEVSSEISRSDDAPANFELIIYEGIHLPLAESSVDVVFSNHLMEHLHPDDAADQLASIFRVLKPRGVYVCVTPNRLRGPHDVSRYFDETPTCFHLREYANTDLARLLTSCGFRPVTSYASAKGRYFRMPRLLITLLESFLDLLPYRFRKRLANTKLLRPLLGVVMVGMKPVS